MEDELEVRVKYLKPHQRAWMCRPELDGPGIDVWEVPDGTLFANPAGHPLVFAELIPETKNG